MAESWEENQARFLKAQAEGTWKPVGTRSYNGKYLHDCSATIPAPKASNQETDHELR